ncbi:MAG: hypothetical protein WC269_03310, partial [Candidatus Gracilibacteria bacterium]
MKNKILTAISMLLVVATLAGCKSTSLQGKLTTSEKRSAPPRQSVVTLVTENGTGTMAVNEDTPRAKLYLDVAPVSNKSITVNLQFSGTATFGQDYSVEDMRSGTLPVVGYGEVTIPPRNSRVSVSILPKDDTIVEPTELITTKITRVKNAVKGTRYNTKVEIKDNDVAVLPEITLTLPEHGAEVSALETVTFKWLFNAGTYPFLKHNICFENSDEQNDYCTGNNIFEDENSDQSQYYYTKIDNDDWHLIIGHVFPDDQQDNHFMKWYIKSYYEGPDQNS